MDLKVLDVAGPAPYGIPSKRRSARKVKVFVFPKGETVLDNLRRRTDRPQKLWNSVVLPKVAEKLGLHSVDTKLYWNQHAGCSCPCSPGFDVYIRDKSVDGKWISYELPYDEKRAWEANGVSHAIYIDIGTEDIGALICDSKTESYFPEKV